MLLHQLADLQWRRNDAGYPLRIVSARTHPFSGRSGTATVRHA
jgi:hypothetical protein